MSEWALAFGLTVLVEAPIYVAVLVGLAGAPWRRSLAVAVVANVLTHPLVWLALHPDLGGGGRYGLVVLAVEAVVVVVEAAVVRVNLPGPTVLLAATALVANAASVLVGSAVLG